MSVDLEEIRKEIKNILNNKSLSDITPKSIRSDLESKFKTDLSDKKTQIDEIIVQELTNKTNEVNKLNESSASENKNNTNENASDESDDDNDDDDDVEPRGKKQKISDEELARKLHAEENSSKRSTASKSSGKKKKDTASAGGGGGGGAAGGGGAKKSAFQKDCYLSKELTDVIGKDKCPRSEVVKSMWQYFKDNKLMDPQNKQFVLCDDKLTALFGKKKFKAFGMMKDLKRHIFDEPTA